MSDDVPLFGFPCYLIGRYAPEALRRNSKLVQSYLHIHPHSVTCLPIFTELDIGEKFLKDEKTAGHLVEFEDPPELAKVIQGVLGKVRYVIVDVERGKSPHTFDLEDFLGDLIEDDRC